MDVLLDREILNRSVLSIFLLNSTLSGILPEGWSAADESGKVRFWEYNSRNKDGSPMDVSKRSPLSRQLDKEKDAKLIADYSKPAFVLDGWRPQSPKKKLSQVFRNSIGEIFEK